MRVPYYVGDLKREPYFRGLPLPVTEQTYLFKEAYIEPIIRNPKKGRSFRLPLFLEELSLGIHSKPSSPHY